MACSAGLSCRRVSYLELFHCAGQQWLGYKRVQANPTRHHAEHERWNAAMDDVSSCSSDEIQVVSTRGRSWSGSSNQDELEHWESPPLVRRGSPDRHARGPRIMSPQAFQAWSPSDARAEASAIRSSVPAEKQKHGGQVDHDYSHLQGREDSGTGSWDSSPAHAPARQSTHTKQRQRAARSRNMAVAKTSLHAHAGLTKKPAEARRSPYRQQPRTHAQRSSPSRDLLFEGKKARNESPPVQMQPRELYRNLEGGVRAQGNLYVATSLEQDKHAAWERAAGHGATAGVQLPARPLGMQLVDAMLGAATSRASGQAGVSAAWL